MQLWMCDVTPQLRLHGLFWQPFGWVTLYQRLWHIIVCSGLLHGTSDLSLRGERMNGTFIFLTKTLRLCQFSWQKKEKKKRKKGRKKKKMCLLLWKAHRFIHSMGQGLSAVTLQFTNCLILLTCVSECVYVRIDLLFFSVESVSASMSSGCYVLQIISVILTRRDQISWCRHHFALSHVTVSTWWKEIYHNVEKVLSTWKSVILSTWLFSDHPQGTKEPYKDTCLTQRYLALRCFNEVLRLKIKNTVLFISLYFVFSVCYLFIVKLLSFYSES